MGFRVNVDPEIDRTEEEQDENRCQSTERQHPELPWFEFAATAPSSFQVAARLLALGEKSRSRPTQRLGSAGRSIVEAARDAALDLNH